jgi:Rieske Fe-S protein
VGFTNPADSKGSLLIHLSSGFVACESACTHQGATINYDPGSGHLVCPLHGAIFDPANAFSVLQGPATIPQPAVSIHVNADGTITTG